MSSRESHNAMLPGWDLVTRTQAEPSALRPVTLNSISAGKHKFIVLTEFSLLLHNFEILV